MRCPKCENELFVHKILPDSTAVYVCVNPQCTIYQQPFNPVIGQMPSVEIDKTKAIPCQACSEPVLFLTDETYKMPTKVDETAAVSENGKLNLNCGKCGLAHEFNVNGKEYVKS